MQNKGGKRQGSGRKKKAPTTLINFRIKVVKKNILKTMYNKKLNKMFEKWIDELINNEKESIDIYNTHNFARMESESIGKLDAYKKIKEIFKGSFSDEKLNKIAKTINPIKNDCFGEGDYSKGKQEGFEEGLIYFRDVLLNSV